MIADLQPDKDDHTRCTRQKMAMAQASMEETTAHLDGVSLLHNDGGSLLDNNAQGPLHVDEGSIGNMDG